MEIHREEGNPSQLMAQLIDNANWPLNSVLVSREHRVMFLPIAKNANTTLKRLFVHLSGHPDRDTILAEDIHSYLTSHRTGLSLCDYSPAEAQAMMDDEQYFFFVVLRNPLQRATSGYLSKFVRDRQFEGPHPETPPVIGPAIDWVYAQRDQAPDYEQSITWKEFVDHLVGNDDDALDTHFKSQASYLDGQVFDCIAALENMNNLVRELETRFEQPVVLEHSNPTARKEKTLRRRDVVNLAPRRLRSMDGGLPNDREMLTRAIAKKLKRRFRRDIKLWKKA